VFPLAVHVIAVVWLAHASPPDPTWIPGLYDDADGDDVVAFIVEASALTGPSPMVAVAVARRHAITQETSEAPRPSACGLTAERAPPLS
jgi:hypothetical protein